MKKCCEEQQLHKIKDQRNMIMKELRKRDLRITKQRKIILDIILSHECTCCKEIYYKANQLDPTIGIATVYRMMNLLEEIGAIDRKNLFRIHYPDCRCKQDGCLITFANKETVFMSKEELVKIIEDHYKKIGPDRNNPITSAEIKTKDAVIKLR